MALAGFLSLVLLLAFTVIVFDKWMVNAPHDKPKEKEKGNDRRTTDL